MKRRLFLALSVITAFASIANAEDDATGWNHRASACMFGAAINGDVTIRGISAAVDASFSDILGNLERGPMLNLRSESDRYALGIDDISMAPGGPTPNGFARAEVDQRAVEASGGVQGNPQIGLFAAVRYRGLDAQLATTGTGSVTLIRSLDWIDPVVEARARMPFSPRSALEACGGFGGFGFGVDITWQTTLCFEYASFESFPISAGNRVLDVDDKTGEGTPRCDHDVTTAGPSTGFSWRS